MRFPFYGAAVLECASEIQISLAFRRQPWRRERRCTEPAFHSADADRVLEHHTQFYRQICKEDGPSVTGGKGDLTLMRRPFLQPGKVVEFATAGSVEATQNRNGAEKE